MQLTIKEMEVLCIFHNGTLSETLDILRKAEANGTWPQTRVNDLKNLIAKLSQMKDGDNVYLAFDVEK